jgi:hypothetical protein
MRISARISWTSDWDAEGVRSTNSQWCRKPSLYSYLSHETPSFRIPSSSVWCKVASTSRAVVKRPNNLWRNEWAQSRADSSAWCPRFAPVPWMFCLITPVLRALTWVSRYSEGRQAQIVLCQQGHPLRRTFRFPDWEPPPQPVHSPLDVISSFTIL